MTKEQVKHLIHILQAYVSGEPLQYFEVNYDSEPYLPLRSKNSELYWKDVNDSHDFNPYLYEYRIKPSSKYRPFENKEECWQEMLKHQPFGWTKSISEQRFYFISKIDDNGCFFSNNDDVSFKTLFASDTFADGTPFGVKEE